MGSLRQLVFHYSLTLTVEQLVLVMGDLITISHEIPYGTVSTKFEKWAYKHWKVSLSMTKIVCSKFTITTILKRDMVCKWPQSLSQGKTAPQII